MTAPREDGFTLVEVLVALVILSGAIIMGFQVFSDGMRRLSAVEARIRTMAVARSEIARFSASANPAEGIHTGEREGLRWKLTVTALTDPAENRSSTIRPLKVEFQAIAEDGAATPILQTIVLGRTARP